MVSTLAPDRLSVVAGLPKETLRRVLLKGSLQMIKCLVMAYPQALGAAFMDALATSVRPGTLRILVEQVSRGAMLTPAQIHGAEAELFKLLDEEHVI